MKYGTSKFSMTLNTMVMFILSENDDKVTVDRDDVIRLTKIKVNGSSGKLVQVRFQGRCT